MVSHGEPIGKSIGTIQVVDEKSGAVTRDNSTSSSGPIFGYQDLLLGGSSHLVSRL